MKLKSCCCCFNLRTGGLIISGFEIFCGFILLRTGISLACMCLYASSIITSLHFISFLVVKFAVGGCLIYGISKVKDARLCGTIETTLTFVFSNIQNQPSCLMPFLIEQGISIFGSTITFVYLIVKMQTDPDATRQFFHDYIMETTDTRDNDDLVDQLIPAIMILTFFLLIQSVYSFLIVYSIYKETKEMSNPIQDSINNHIHPALQAGSYNSNPPPYSFYPPDQTNLGFPAYPSQPHQNLAFSTFPSQLKNQKTKGDNDLTITY